MIYNRDESEVTTLGEIEKHSVSIDARNINHIVTILSSNLYSYPMISFLRETVSNAVDSHVEAGVNEPIIITRTRDDISIRDFGTGISPERFRDIYLNIGSSTKRESNDYIGNFGIGRFSALSVSKLANITSFYNGKAYYYVMNMDIDQLHIDKVYELDTTERNGVEVKIPIKKFNAQELDCIGFIENVYVECVKDEDNSFYIGEFNKRKIHTFKTFKTITYEYRSASEKTEILLGKIPYGVDYLGLWDFTDNWHRSWKEAMETVYPCINIGEVDITPNRETLLYSDRTKECLRKAYDRCIEELTERWNAYCDTEYDEFTTWVSSITQWRKNRLELEGTSIVCSDKLAFNAKLKNHPEWNSIDPKEKKSLVNYLTNYSLETLGILDGGTMFKGRKELSITVKRLLDTWITKASIYDRMILVVPTQSGFSSKYFKNFVEATYPNKKILFLRRRKVSVDTMKHTIRQIFGVNVLTDPILRSFVVSLVIECYRTIQTNSVYKDIINSPEYQQYKKDHQNPRTYVARHTGKINFTVINTEWYNPDKKNITIDELLVFLKKNYKHKRVVYSTLDSPFLSAFHKIQYPNLVIISAAKNNMKYLEEGLPEWISPIESLYNPNNKVLIRFKTIQWIEKQKIELKPYDIFPSWIRKKITELRHQVELYNIYKQNNNYNYIDASSVLDIVPEDKYDLWIMGEYNELLPYIKLAYKLSRCAYISNSYSNTDLKYYILMKAKKLRLCFEYYTKIKDRINELVNEV